MIIHIITQDDYIIIRYTIFLKSTMNKIKSYVKSLKGRHLNAKYIYGFHERTLKQNRIK